MIEKSKRRPHVNGELMFSPRFCFNYSYKYVVFLCYSVFVVWLLFLHCVTSLKLIDLLTVCWCFGNVTNCSLVEFIFNRVALRNCTMSSSEGDDVSLIEQPAEQIVLSEDEDEEQHANNDNDKRHEDNDGHDDEEDNNEDDDDDDDAAEQDEEDDDIDMDRTINRTGKQRAMQRHKQSTPKSTKLTTATKPIAEKRFKSHSANKTNEHDADNNDDEDMDSDSPNDNAAAASLHEHSDEEDNEEENDDDYDEDDDDDDQANAAANDGDDNEDAADSDSGAVAEEPPSFAAALGLHRVGSKLPARPQSQQPVQVLNARGMPARIRKKNKLFFDDEHIVNERPQRMSPAKRQSVTATASAVVPSQQQSLRGHSASGGSATKTTTVAQQQQSPIKTTPSKLMKKRKGVVSRYMQIKEESKRKRAAELEKEQREEAAAARVARTATASASSTAAAAGNQSGSNTTPNTSIHRQPPPSSSPVVTINAVERKCFERVGLRLRNLLKLPKAHKWVSYEWFYSYIDRPLLTGDNDFQICLRGMFPQLQTRQLTRSEWSHIRSLMGKPRRCSAAFLSEERDELERRRHKIRVLQSAAARKQLAAAGAADAEYLRHLPAEIPLALPIGTKVTARLRYPQDGIYTGSVQVVDSVNSAYRIAFDKVGLGTHTVQDIEIFASDYAEMLPVASVLAQEAQAMRLKQNGGSGTIAGKASGSALASAAAALAAAAVSNRNDPLLGSEIFNNSKLKALMIGQGIHAPGTGPSSNSAAAAAAAAAAAVAKSSTAPAVNGFHFKLLELMIRTRKTLAAKTVKLQRLKNMNAEAEMSVTLQHQLPDDYQRRYASIVIGMEKLNREMQVGGIYIHETI